MTAHVITDEYAAAGDIVLCRLKDGGFALAAVHSTDTPGGYKLYRTNGAEELAAVVGRVVMVSEAIPERDPRWSRSEMIEVPNIDIWNDGGAHTDA